MNVFGYEIQRIRSVFRNPNPAGFFFMIGFVTLSVLYIERDRKSIFFAACINGLGLFLTESRAGYLGALMGILFFLILYTTDAKRTRIAIWCYSLLSALGIVILANIIPRPSFISPTDLGNRPGLWEGGVQAVAESPLGYGTQVPSHLINPYLIPELAGQGIHNAYLRLFLSTGIIGGIAYALFTIYCLLTAIHENGSTGDYIVLAVAISIATKEIFEGNTIFGLSMSSILASITFGYAISGSYER